MNERIKELEKQCWDNQTNHLNAEKFVELIVRECVEAAEEAQADFYVINNIKTRFGVEE
jgi:ribosomal protein S24E